MLQIEGVLTRIKTRLPLRSTSVIASLLERDIVTKVEKARKSRNLI